MKKLSYMILGTAGLLFLGNVTTADISPVRSLDFTYHVILKDLPARAEKIQVWLPHLPDTPYQKIEQVTITPQPDQVTYDRDYNNKIIHFTLNSASESQIELKANYKIKRYEISNPNSELENNSLLKSSTSEVFHPVGEALPVEKALMREDLSQFLKPNRLVTISNTVEAIAQEVTKDKISNRDKARAIYDYVFENVSYDKSIPGYGNGDTERVCRIKAGNCTDFHSLFISLARASGIPAKFVIGIPIAPERKGRLNHYHCWAEFYQEQLGWVPVDISEAWKDKTKKEYLFGSLDPNRLEFSQGRDILLQPTSQGGPLNYFVFPYVEINGQEFKNVEVSFSYEDVAPERLTQLRQ